MCIWLFYELKALMVVGRDIPHTNVDLSGKISHKTEFLCIRSVIVEELVNFSLNPELIFEPDMIFLIL